MPNDDDRAQAKETRPYGLWPSPLTPAGMAQGKRLSDVQWDSDGETLVWLEGRSDRGVLVCASANGDAPRDLTGDLSVRAQVGYGGGDFTVARGYAYFAEQSSGRLYRQSLAAGPAAPLTPAFGHAAAPAVSPDGRWVVYVHTDERVDRLAIVDAEGTHWPRHIAGGADFAMQPTWHPDGTRLAWIAWDHPRMPWDGTRLHLATVRPAADGGLPTLADARVVAGGDEVAIFQPEFSPDGRSLAYISNESGWDNLYLYDLETGTARALTDERADLGQPAWAQGLRAYAFTPDGRALLYLRNEGGSRALWAYDLRENRAEPLPAFADYTWLAQPAVAPATGRFAALASAPAIPTRVISTDEHASTPRVRARSASEAVPAADLATPRAIEWPVSGGATAHGLYYPPAGSRHAGAGLPPAIVLVHGGPTGQATTAYDAGAQFFATRGYAVLQVNYRGSAGYGRAYIQALRENWGVYDVEDTVGGARYLADNGLADGDRLVVMGGSAGGYTVLQTLVTHPGAFKAAVCMFGISNLFTLAADTHKFEERYLDSLIGPLPEASARYRERSPLFFADRIRDPVAVFQGAIDRVVPREQSDAIVEALRRRGVPHEYHVYEGEGHGWRKSETIAAFYTTVERFLKQYVLFG
ncbi:MAG TPA: S9 family peptidase [Thermomicrobiales bacterium]|nr:S9 family peptidase [Thermomicrobiales bacterium]